LPLHSNSQKPLDKHHNMKKILTNASKFLLFFGVGFGILYYVYQGQQTAFQAQCDLDFVKECIAKGKTETACNALAKPECSLAGKVADDFRTVKLFWIFIVVLAFLVSNVSRALRWQMLVKPMGYATTFANTFWPIMAGYFANLALPRMGEVVRAGLFSRYENVPIEKAFGTIVTDRIMDVLCLLAMMALAFVLEFDILWKYVSENAFGEATENGGEKSYTVIWIGLGVMLAVAIVSFIFRKKIFAKLKQILTGFGEGLLTIRKLDRVGMFLFHTATIWLMYYLMTYLCFFAFEPTATLTHATSLPVIGLAIFVFGSLGMVIPSPGGMGSYQFLVTEGLMIYGLANSDAFSFSLIIFVTITVCNIIFGILAFIILPILNRKSVTH